MIAKLAPTQLALAGLCGALTLVLAYEIAAPIAPFEMPKGEQAYMPAAPRFQDSATAPSAANFSAIDTRSIFNPARTPIAGSPEVTDTQAAGALPSDISLIGVIIEGQTRLALVKSASAPYASSVSEGDAIEGWKVSRIDPDRIVLQAGPNKQEILLEANRAAQTPSGQSSAGEVPPASTEPAVGNKPASENPSTSQQQ